MKIKGKTDFCKKWNIKWNLTCFRDFLIIGWGLSSSSEKARVRGSKSRPDDAIESATRDKPYCIRDESTESVSHCGKLVTTTLVTIWKFKKKKNSNLTVRDTDPENSKIFFLLIYKRRFEFIQKNIFFLKKN